MTLKEYQPDRIDFLTDRAIPADMLSAQEAKSGGRKLFHNRWVTKEEKKQLREEQATYQSIRVIGGLLIFLTLYPLINIRGILRDGTVFGLVVILYGAALLSAGIGLIKFRKFARNIAILVITFFSGFAFYATFQ